MKKYSFVIVLVVALLFSLLAAFSLSNNKSGNSLGGEIYNKLVSFDEGIAVDGSTIIDGSGNFTTANLTTTGDLSVGGKLTSQLYQNLTGSTFGGLKIHDHLTTADYVAQLRSETVKTSGTHWGIDSETHLAANATTSLRGVQGVSVVDTGYTATDPTILGLYGQTRVDGGVVGSGFLAGIYGLIEDSSAVTASHVASAWLDSHQDNTVTGSHQLLYMSNNGTATMDEATYLYCGDKITSFATLDTCGGMVSGPSTAASGTPVKIQIMVGTTPYFLNAYPTSNN